MLLSEATTTGFYALAPLIVFFPLAGLLLNIIIGGRLPEKGVGHSLPGQKAAHVQEDVKAQAAAGYVKIVLKKGQVAGTGNGEKLGNALNHAEEDGDKGVHNGGMYHGKYQQAI